VDNFSGNHPLNHSKTPEYALQRCSYPQDKSAPANDIHRALWITFRKTQISGKFALFVWITLWINRPAMLTKRNCRPKPTERGKLSTSFPHVFHTKKGVIHRAMWINKPCVEHPRPLQIRKPPLILRAKKNFQKPVRESGLKGV